MSQDNPLAARYTFAEALQNANKELLTDLKNILYPVIVAGVSKSFIVQASVKDTKMTIRAFIQDPTSGLEYLLIIHTLRESKDLIVAQLRQEDGEAISSDFIRTITPAHVSLNSSVLKRVAAGFISLVNSKES